MAIVKFISRLEYGLYDIHVHAVLKLLTWVFDQAMWKHMAPNDGSLYKASC